MKLFISTCNCVCAALVMFSNPVPMANLAQQAKPQVSYPVRLPYGFSNFVWWSDDELRALLKKRVPGLDDEVPTTNASMGKVRDALTALLKEKGIVAEVQSTEPSLDNLRVQEPQPLDFWRVQFPPPPKPQIEFSILTPSVMIGKIALMPQDEQAWQAFENEAQESQGKPFGRFGVEFLCYRAQEVLRQRGYLSAEVESNQPPPRKENGKWLVDLVLTARAGPRYTISAISVDGGPLLQGRDFSRLLLAKVGDSAGPNPFGRLGGAIRAYYEHAGFMDVDIESKPTFDVANAKVAYQLMVTQGPQYHLRSLAVQRLTPEQESRVRALLGMKAGDVYDGTAVNDLYHKLSTESSLAALSFSFNPAQDKPAAAMDLTLNFFKVSDESHVTVK